MLRGSKVSTWMGVVRLNFNKFWRSFSRQLNGFMSKIVSNTRYFDLKFWTALHGIQLRTEAAIDSLFWVSSNEPSNASPLSDTARSKDILTTPNDNQYPNAWVAARKPDSLKFTLRSRSKFQKFTANNVPALRAVINQVVRWLIPSPETSSTRSSTPYDMKQVLKDGFFEPKGFEHPALAVEKLISLVRDRTLRSWLDKHCWGRISL